MKTVGRGLTWALRAPSAERLSTKCKLWALQRQVDLHGVSVKSLILSNLKHPVLDLLESRRA